MYGRIGGIIGTERHFQYQIRFRNGNENEFAMGRTFRRTFDPTCSYFDNVASDGDLNQSVCSLSSSASKSSNRHAKSNVRASPAPVKKGTMHRTYLFFNFCFIL